MVGHDRSSYGKRGGRTFGGLTDNRGGQHAYRNELAEPQANHLPRRFK